MKRTAVFAVFLVIALLVWAAVTTQKPLTITVHPAPNPLAITENTMPDAWATVAYSQALHVTGGVGPFTWSVVSGTLPPGLTLTSSGATATIAGTPTTQGAYTFTIQVSDAQGASAQAAMRVQRAP